MLFKGLASSLWDSVNERWIEGVNEEVREFLRAILS